MKGTIQALRKLLYAARPKIDRGRKSRRRTGSTTDSAVNQRQISVIIAAGGPVASMPIKKITRFTLTVATLMLLIAGWNSKAACEPAEKNGGASTVATTGKCLVIVPDKIDWQPTGLLPPGAQMA